MLTERAEQNSGTILFSKLRANPKGWGLRQSRFLAALGMTSFEMTLCINGGPRRSVRLGPAVLLVVLPPRARGNYVMRSCGHRRLALTIAPEYCVEHPRVDCVWPREIHALRLFRPCGLGRIRAVKQAVLAIAKVGRKC